jgi:hypothetical protein
MFRNSWCYATGWYSPRGRRWSKYLTSWNRNSSWVVGRTAASRSYVMLRESLEGDLRLEQTDSRSGIIDSPNSKNIDFTTVQTKQTNTENSFEFYTLFTFSEYIYVIHAGLNIKFSGRGLSLRVRRRVVQSTNVSKEQGTWNVKFYRSTRHHISGDSTIHSHCCDCLISNRFLWLSA